jgi:hypothetical protein
MLWTLFVVLLVSWFLGVVGSYTLGGFIHLLLVIALIAVVLQDSRARDDGFGGGAGESRIHRGAGPSRGRGDVAGRRELSAAGSDPSDDLVAVVGIRISHAE